MAGILKLMSDERLVTLAHFGKSLRLLCAPVFTTGVLTAPLTFDVKKEIFSEVKDYSASTWLLFTHKITIDKSGKQEEIHKGRNNV